MNQTAFHKLSYGVYIVSVKGDSYDGGCVINTFSQVTSSPAQVSITLNKNNETLKLIQKSKTFCATILTQDVDMELIKTFGFQSSKDANKFESIAFKYDTLNNPYPVDGIASYFSCKVVNCIELSTHILLIGEVVDAQVLSDVPVLTYADYHKKKSNVKVGYRCDVCGYILESEDLPEDYICPICKKDASHFIKL